MQIRKPVSRVIGNNSHQISGASCYLYVNLSVFHIAIIRIGKSVAPSELVESSISPILPFR